ncbi:MAG: DUF1987 domain-containing protein [Candidatus Cyclobacteriaceae bacterium M3_2C_046]
MDSFFLKPSPKTPEIKFDIEKSLFEVSGRSIPENSIDFYKPVLEWLDQYIKHPNSETTLEIKLEYFNTSSSKCLVDIFRRFEKLHIEGKKVSILWYYEDEDEDMLESGEDFKGIIKMPLQLVKLSTYDD